MGDWLWCCYSSVLFIFFSNNHPAIPQASLEFASLCLRNAMLCLEPFEVEKPTPEESADGM